MPQLREEEVQRLVGGNRGAGPLVEMKQGI